MKGGWQGRRNLTLHSPKSGRARRGRGTTASALAAGPASLCLGKGDHVELGAATIASPERADTGRQRSATRHDPEGWDPAGAADNRVRPIASAGVATLGRQTGMRLLGAAYAQRGP